MPENIFTFSIVLFFCGHRLVVVFTILKTVYSAVGGRVAKLISWWQWAGQSRVQIPSGASDFSVLKNIQTSFWGSASLLFCVNHELFPLGVKQLEYEAEKSHPFNVNLMKECRGTTSACMLSRHVQGLLYFLLLCTELMHILCCSLGGCIKLRKCPGRNRSWCCSCLPLKSKQVMRRGRWWWILGVTATRTT